MKLDKFKKNSLKANVWIYLIIFTLIIITIIWFFQVVFIDSFYEYSKSKQIKQTANKIVENYTSDKYDLDKLSFDKDVCIEIVVNKKIIYSSNNYNKGCIVESGKYINDFYSNNYTNRNYEIINPRFNNKTLIYAVKLNENTSIFVNASLEPLDNTVVILSKQLIIVSIIVIILSFVIGYFISKKISRPIENINNKAKKLAKGNYDFNFDNNSNIYEIDELANTLNYAKSELEQTDELRRELLSNVSHDLKTPLTMIKGYAEMVRDITYKDKNKRNDNLNIIIEETDRLNLLVEDILTLSKIESNKDEIKLERFDICLLVRNIINRYDIYKQLDGYIFVLNIPDSLYITADKKKIEQVIYNLVNNAINYTGNDNKIIINIKTDNNIKIEIIDTGEGINEEDIPFIWDKYYHSKKKHKRNLVGSGIGLSIVKKILESHDFEYGVVSSNEGTMFYFIINE